MKFKKLAFLGFVAIGLTSNLWGQTAEGNGGTISHATTNAHYQVNCSSNNTVKIIDKICEKRNNGNSYKCKIIYECIKK